MRQHGRGRPSTTDPFEDLLTRPRGRPSHAPLVLYRSLQYQAAASWDRPRRVIAEVEHHLGELFPRVGFVVTTFTGTNRAVVRFDNQRGTAEQWIKEGKEGTHWTRLSCHRFRSKEARLLLGVIAYNLGNLLRRAAHVESRITAGGSVPAVGVRGRQGFGACGATAAGIEGTARATCREWTEWARWRHVVCSAAAGEARELGPYRKSGTSIRRP